MQREEGGGAGRGVQWGSHSGPAEAAGQLRYSKTCGAACFVYALSRSLSVFSISHVYVCVCVYV